MNGSILGMSRREIARKFDEIVAFSEIEQFLDTPVKRYSSGMYVRLAFGVAAHLEPEILIVDEVLAVGDAGFQKKCLGKMAEVGRHGLTVLFVSHNMPAVSSLCNSVIWLKQGQLCAYGDPQDTINRYLSNSAGEEKTGHRDLRAVPRQDGDQKVRFLEIQLRDSQGETCSAFRLGEPIEIHLKLESAIQVAGEVNYTIKTMDGLALFTSSSNDSGHLLDIEPGVFNLRARIDPNYLRPGPYLIQVSTICRTCRDLITEAIEFEVVRDRHYSSGSLYTLPGHLHFPSYRWESL
jgi:lipopolysaccharide transport system ATP-binding protein